MDRDVEVEVHKNAKREWGQYPAILTELAWSIRDLSYGLKNTEKMIFIFVYFWALKRKPVICNSDGAFWFSCSLVPSCQRNHRKSFYCRRKHFVKENFHALTWTSAKFYSASKMGNPERVVLLHLACLGSQWEHRIRCILPTCGAHHIISMC